MKAKEKFLSWARWKRIIPAAVFYLCVIVVAVAIGISNILCSANTGKSDYSIDSMKSNLAVIAEKEHSIYDAEAHKEVRDYISGTLFSYGVENEIITHLPRYTLNEKTDEVHPYRPQNIYAEIEGKSGVNILLLSHYDSCPYKIKYGEASEGSKGAFDDGYGTVAALELARIFAKSQPENGIKLAFFDAEESGILGSEALVEEYPEWLSDVNLVINIEARGNKGPVYMFETSGNNSKLVEFYKRAGFPYTFSLAADIYGMLPNDTDLSPFIDNGYAGMNLATLDSLKVYHNEHDNMDGVDEGTLARYCNTLIPLLEEYTQNKSYGRADYFTSSHDSLFFTLFPNAMVSYSEVTGWIFFGITLALIAFITAFSIWKKKINYKKLLISIGLDIAFLAVVCGLGFVIALLGCAFAGANYHLIFVICVSCDLELTIAFAVVAAGGFIAHTFLKGKLGVTHRESACGGLIFFGLLSIVCAAVVFGGSFAFVIPAFLAALGEISALFIKPEKVRKIVYGCIAAVGGLFTVSLYVSLLYSLYVALTFGALGFLLIIAILPFMLFAPSAAELWREETQKEEHAQAAELQAEAAV